MGIASAAQPIATKDWPSRPEAFVLDHRGMLGILPAGAWDEHGMTSAKHGAPLALRLDLPRQIISPEERNDCRIDHRKRTKLQRSDIKMTIDPCHRNVREPSMPPRWGSGNIGMGACYKHGAPLA